MNAMEELDLAVRNQRFWDDRVRVLALRAMDEGVASAKVAEAAGVHRATLYRWRDEQ